MWRLCFVFLSQLELITAQAMKAGFTGGMVVDYPNSSKAKKWLFLLDIFMITDQQTYV